MALERDVAFLSLINKAMELNTISMNETRNARYANIGTLLFNIQQTLQDGIRETYVDDPLMEVDSTKYKNVPDSQPTSTQNTSQNNNPFTSDDEDEEYDDEEDDDV